MDNKEFQDSTSSLTNTETELNSAQQGYIKAITKLVRSIETANHHIQLLKTAIDKKRPLRGLIPKISPKVPDTPGNFIIKWEGIQQETGLHLTETRTKQTNTTAKETKHQRKFQRTITHIINISKYKLTPGETFLLSKGLNFIPTSKREHPVKLLQDILLFDRRLRLKYFFQDNNYTQPKNKTTQHYTQVLDGHHLQDRTPS